MTEPYYQDASVTILHGDCRDVLRELPDCSVDSVVTDPPYALNFMGKKWDSFAAAEGRREFPCAVCRQALDDGRDLRQVWPDYEAHRLSHDVYMPAVTGSPFQQWCELWAAECLRVLKPGGHMLAFGGTRTWHRLVCAVEDAGFEIRDSIAWLYGSGFPKSLDVSKAIDKAAVTALELKAISARARGDQKAERAALDGLALAERKVIGHRNTAAGASGYLSAEDQARTGYRPEGRDFKPASVVEVTAPATTEAAQWAGWGTALKPAHEPICVARKPLAGNVAANVLAYGTGALNIDATRIGMSDADRERLTEWHAKYGGKKYAESKVAHGGGVGDIQPPNPAGRWPANVVLDESQAAALDQMSGELTSGANPTRRGSDKFRDAYGEFKGQEECVPARGADIGGASRFFYVAREDESCSTDDTATTGSASATAGLAGISTAVAPAIETLASRFTYTAKAGSDERITHNGIAHSTVKPLSLMRWLVRLVTPPISSDGKPGLVLDPFSGSGTTAEACILEGFRCIAIEREADYLPLITQRIHRRRDPVAYLTEGGHDLGLFGDDDPDEDVPSKPSGRWPANVVMDRSQADALDEMSGESGSNWRERKKPAGGIVGNGNTHGHMQLTEENQGGFMDTGGASRFFYVTDDGAS